MLKEDILFPFSGLLAGIYVLCRNLNVTLLVLSVAVLAVGASLPDAISQAFTTVTTSSLLTRNTYSTENLGLTTQTATFTSVFLSLTDTVGGSGPYCWYDDFQLNIPAGTSAVTGIIGPPSAMIDFYIMNPVQYTVFQEAGCRGSAYAAIVEVHGLTSAYNLNWQNPSTGVYQVVVFDETPRQSFTVAVIVDVLSAEEQTSSAYYVITGEVTLSVPATYVTTVQASSLTSGPYSIPFTGLSREIIGGIIVAVLAVAGALYLAKSREKRKSQEETQLWGVQEGAKSEQETEGKQFCLNCGRQLPVNSKFCNHCGATQE